MTFFTKDSLHFQLYPGDDVDHKPVIEFTGCTKDSFAVLDICENHEWKYFSPDQNGEIDKSIKLFCKDPGM